MRVLPKFNEDGAHLFFKCKLTERVWNLLGLNREREQLALKSSANDVIDYE